ncbi:MAG: hypothetical protein A2201_07870 [Alicyclobacillus sp. RIFOXYA1_FULL_53_8]|nr:MAG: hypothetical protein A2201_07870 [Alicyclobacillus sp. RIFOXYA1_FULL_53_8]
MSGTIRLFLLILMASFAFSAILSKIPLLRIPSAVSYLVFGMLLQTGTLVPMTPDELLWLKHLGELGLLFLMFLSGLEVDVSLLNPKAWNSKQETSPLYLGMFVFLGTFVASFSASWMLSRFSSTPVAPMMLTLLFATTSLGIIFPMLEESGILHTDYGQTLLLSALLADLSTMFLVSYFVSLKTSGEWTDFLLTLIILPAIALVYLVLVRLRKVSYVRSFAGNLQTRVRAAVALMAAAGALADFTGSEPILGTFLVGILVSAMPFAFKPQLRDYSHGLGYGFFIPVFFISVGLRFRFQLFHDDRLLAWVPALFVTALLVKLIPSWYLRHRFGSRRALAGGFLLSARLGLAVAAAGIAVRIGALPPFLAEAMILVAVLTSLMAPIVFLSLTWKTPT